jgi:hypothetical protein
MKDYWNRRSEQIEKFCEKHKLEWEYVDGFIKWFEWQAEQKQKELIAKVLELRIK